MNIIKARMERLRTIVGNAPPGFSVDDIIEGNENVLFKKWIYAEERANRRRF